MTTGDAPSITLEGVSKWYGEVLGLNEVTAVFGPGVTGLLGPNGAGKSTMMKLMAGMLAPNIGRVRVCGRRPFNRPRIMRRVGLVPEQDATYPGASVLAVVSYLTRLHGFSAHDARHRAQEALERCGLGHALKRSAAEFSKGMRQRAKLAQALAHDPDVLILDEPLNGLDPPGRREMGALIRELGAEGRCVLVSSHILHEVQALSGRVLFLFSGRVLADGTVGEIRAELPEHPLTIRIGTRDGPGLAADLLEVEGIRRIEMREGGMEVLTTRADDLFDRLAAISESDGSRVLAVEPVDEDLEAVFRYLTR